MVVVAAVVVVVVVVVIIIIIIIRNYSSDVNSLKKLKGPQLAVCDFFQCRAGHHVALGHLYSFSNTI